jgi:hypothetical protein
MEACSSAVSDLVERRRCRLDDGVKRTLSPRHRLPAGRLLCFDVKSSLYFEAPQAGSQGFFDAFDVPPWDTWVGCSTVSREQHRIAWATPQPDGHWPITLLTWVPQAMVELAEGGIAADPVRPYAWLPEGPPLEDVLGMALRLTKRR